MTSWFTLTLLGTATLAGAAFTWAYQFYEAAKYLDRVAWGFLASATALWMIERLPEIVRLIP